MRDEPGPISHNVISSPAGGVFALGELLLLLLRRLEVTFNCTSVQRHSNRVNVSKVLKYKQPSRNKLEDETDLAMGDNVECVPYFAFLEDNGAWWYLEYSRHRSVYVDRPYRAFKTVDIAQTMLQRPVPPPPCISWLVGGTCPPE